MHVVGKKIICLANSKKHGERCVAGIDIDTGRWIRPVYDNGDGSIPRTTRLVEGREPELLDVVEIPLASNGDDFGFASENLSILPGQWKLLGKVSPTDMVRYCANTTNILHNPLKYVLPSYLKELPFAQRRSLQLVQVQAVDMTIVKKHSGWRGSLRTPNGHLTEASITDPVLLERLERGHQLNGPLLVTVSLSMPHSPDIKDWDKGDVCWKLIAGVIEIPRAVTEPDFDNLPF